MSDTDTRSVAEIIGWTKCTLRQAIHNGKTTTYYERPGTSGPSEPTPDDMLAWLRESPWHVSRMTPGTPEGTRRSWACRPAVVMLDPRGRERWLHAPTLHAALEAAVRAVANERTPE